MFQVYRTTVSRTKNVGRCQSADGVWSCASGPHWPSIDDAIRRALEPITWPCLLSLDVALAYLAQMADVHGERDQWASGPPLPDVVRDGGTCLDWCALALSLALAYHPTVHAVWLVERIDEQTDHMLVRLETPTCAVVFDPGTSRWLPP